VDRIKIYSHDPPSPPPEPSELALVTPEHTLIVWEYVRDEMRKQGKLPVIARRDDGKVREISGSSFFLGLVAVSRPREMIRMGCRVEQGGGG